MPFVLEKDIDYVNNLRDKYSLFLNQACKAGADEESISIIKNYKKRILSAIKSYYQADIAKSYTIVKNLIVDVSKNSFAVDQLNNSKAFLGEAGEEIQFFRCRVGSPTNSFSRIDMLHLPRELRAKSGNYRFSIPGNPCYYLSNSSYGCWIETGCPAENEFNVAPIVLDGTQKIFNLAVSTRNIAYLNELEKSRVHCWIKLLMLAIATSYIIKEEGRSFKSEYIVSQAIMVACKKLKYDGVAYLSKRVSDELFSFCAINIALFVHYKNNKKYSDILNHMKIDDAFNYALYKQLLPSQRYKEYELRSVHIGTPVTIGNYNSYFPYKETEFYEFDRFLFASWQNKPNKKGKDSENWGVVVDD